MMESSEIFTGIFLVIIVFVIFAFVIDNPFVTWESCNDQGANNERRQFGFEQCVPRTEHGCSGSSSCEEIRAKECAENPESNKWYCNLDEQRRYYKGER